MLLATELENTAGQTYVMAGGVLTTPQLRAAIMSIGMTEGRHLTALYPLQGLVPVPLSIFSTAKATPPDSLHRAQRSGEAAQPAADTNHRGACLIREHGR